MSAVSATKYIKRALRILEVLAQGANPTGSETADGLEALNAMLEAWSTKGLTIYDRKRETFTLSAGTAQYSIGSSGTFDTVWPLDIKLAGVLQAGNTDEIPIKIITQQEWSRIVDKATQSIFPQRLYYNRTYPLGEINLWPVPSAASTLVIYSLKQLSTFATATATADLPPGFDEAIAYNLAKRLAPEYGRTLNADAKELAMSSFADIQRYNWRPILMTNDAAHLTDGKRRGFDYLIGE